MTVAYNTSYSEPALPSGPYDSLNVAISESWEKTLTVGTDPTPALYVESNSSEMCCGSPASPSALVPSGLEPGNECWEEWGGYQPVIEVKR